MQHLALIMDGNRRWANTREVSLHDGYVQGRQAAKRVVQFCLARNIKYLSLYTFSLENFKRTSSEQDAICDNLIEAINGELDSLLAQKVKVTFVGDRDKFPAHTRADIERLEAKSASCDRLFLNLLFCYGAQQEIIHVIKTIAHEIEAGQRVVDDIDERLVRKMLWTADTPDPDLIIRTSGVKRLSNFLLYQAAYSDFAFIDCFWPDLTEGHLQRCVDEYYQIKQNYGT